MEEKAAVLVQKTVSAFSEHLASGAGVDFQFVCKRALALAAEVNSEKIAGSEKKELVLRTLKAAVKEAFEKVSDSANGPSVEVIDDWVNSVLPTTLDLVIGAARGKMAELSPVEAAVAVVEAVTVHSAGCVGVCLASAPGRGTAGPSLVERVYSFVRCLLAGPATQASSAQLSVEQALSDKSSAPPQKELVSPPESQCAPAPEAPPVAQPPADESVKSE